MTAFLALVRKDLLQYLQNRRALIMSLLAPILIGAFFGSLFNPKDTQIRQLPVAVVDQDSSPSSARVLASLQSDGSFAIQLLDAASAQDQVQRGKLRAAITLPAGFGAQAGLALRGAGPKPELTLVYDPSQAMVPALVRGLLAQHVARAVAQQAYASGGATGPALSLPYTLSEQASRAADGGLPASGYDSYAHAFAGMATQFVLLMSVDIGIGLLLLRRTGLWLRLRVAPVSRAQLLGSRMASAALISLLVFAVVFAVAIGVFGVRVHGAVIGLVAVMLATSLASASFGLMIAALGRSPEATRGLAILVTLLLVMVGGAWVPSFLFPPWLQAVAAWTPIHWAVAGMDAMTWRALPLQAAAAPVAALCGFALLFGAVGLWRFRWDE